MATSEANLKNPDNKDNNEESPSTSPFKNPKILIGIIVISVIVIVAVVVIAVVLAKSDDSSESSVVEDDIGDERWVEAYEKAKNFLKSFSYEEKYLLLYGEYNVAKTCVGGISPIPERGFPGICLQDGPAGVRPSNYATTWQASINSAATFNRDLVREVGFAQAITPELCIPSIILAPNSPTRKGSTPYDSQILPPLGCFIILIQGVNIILTPLSLNSPACANPTSRTKSLLKVAAEFIEACQVVA